MSEASQPEESKNTLIVGHHYPAIDGLRGLAVLLVIWFHASLFAKEMLGVPIHGIQNSYYILSMWGETGVDLFFVLSGFLITGILIDVRYEQHIFKNFYARRALRIFPLYYVCLFVFVIFALIFGKYEVFDARLWAHLFYLQNWLPDYNFDAYMYLNHTWSLAVEEQFYLFWPFLFLFLYKRSETLTMLFCLCLVLVSWVLRAMTYDTEYYKLAYSATVFRLDGLMLGALLAILVHSYRSWFICNRNVFLFPMLCSVLAVFYAVVTSQNTDGFQHTLMYYGLFCGNIFYVSLLAYIFLQDEGSFLVRGLKKPVFREIGKISYGIYIVHVPVMLFLGHQFVSMGWSYWGNHLALLLAGTTLSVCIAFLSYRYFEKPILVFKSRYAPMKVVHKDSEA